MELALMDRMWVNTWRTDANNMVLNGAYANGDGTYDIVITSDICGVLQLLELRGPRHHAAHHRG